MSIFKAKAFAKLIRILFNLKILSAAHSDQLIDELTVRALRDDLLKRNLLDAEDNNVESKEDK